MEDPWGPGIVLRMQSQLSWISNLMGGADIKQMPADRCRAEPGCGGGVQLPALVCRAKGILGGCSVSYITGPPCLPTRPSIWGHILCLVSILRPQNPEAQTHSSRSWGRPASNMNPQVRHWTQGLGLSVTLSFIPQSFETSRPAWEWIQTTTESQFPHLWIGENPRFLTPEDSMKWNRQRGMNAGPGGTVPSMVAFIIYCYYYYIRASADERTRHQPPLHPSGQG